MRLAAHIGVKDEIELLPQCIDHLRTIGVELFIVCDMASTDGTREYLQGHEDADFRVLDSSNSESAELWRERNAAAIRECRADWVLAIDADEFPLTESGDLREAFAGVEGDLLFIPRFNVVLGPQGPHLPLPCPPSRFDEVELIVKAPQQFKQQLADDPNLPWIRFVPLPKLAVRPSIVANIRDGMHDIIPVDGHQPSRSTSKSILLSHVALSTYSRFQQKISNIREVFHHHDGKLGAGFGWHWRRWQEIDDRGALEREFRNSIFFDQEMEMLRKSCVVCNARQILQAQSRDDQ
jgi:glycosyltransferase involved in cell wall biosynthesis